MNVKDVWFDSYDEEGTLRSLACVTGLALRCVLWYGVGHRESVFHFSRTVATVAYLFLHEINAQIMQQH